MTGEVIKGNCEESPVAIGRHHGSLKTSVILVITVH